MRVAVIGCGSVGARHARNLKAQGVTRLLLLDADVSRITSLADELDADYGTLHGAADLSGCDAAIVATPASTHFDIATELLQASYCGPLFVEKPLALSSVECSLFRSWPHATTMTGYNWRWNPEVSAMIRRHQGTTFFAHLRMDTDIATWPGSGYGDPLLECSHEIDLVQFWSAGRTLTQSGVLENGAGMWFSMPGFHTPGFHIDLRWRSAQPSRVYTVEDLRSLTVDRLEPSQASINESYVHELQYFLSCVQAGVSTQQGFDTGADVVTICEDARAKVTA